MSSLLVHIVFAGAELFVLVLLFRYTRRLFVFLDANRESIARASPGKALFHGTVEPLEKRLESPMGKTPCVYYEMELERRDRRFAETISWTSDGTFTDAVPFLLSDATGKIRVEGRSIGLISPLMFPRYRLSNPKIDAEYLFRKIHQEEKLHSEWNDFQAYEHTIQPGANVFIMGSVTNRNGTLVLTNGKDPLYISSQPFSKVVRKTMLAVFLFFLLACIVAIGIFAPFH